MEKRYVYRVWNPAPFKKLLPFLMVPRDISHLEQCMVVTGGVEAKAIEANTAWRGEERDFLGLEREGTRVWGDVKRHSLHF